MAVSGQKGGENDLRRALHMRHLIMLSVGGTIASGFLLFSGFAISIAGPAVIISYAVAGIVSVAVMACLAELAVAKPVSGSFATYARDTMGALPGFLTGWNYWLAWVMGAATESVAAGTYLHSFYPSIPIWVTAFVITAVEMIINLVGVLFMGEYEFALSTIKLIALGVFMVLGILAILGIGFSSPGVSAYTSNGGFFPKGGGAVIAALLTVFFAYVGIELVGVAAEESVDPERDIPAALMRTAWIVVVLFVVSILVLMALLPWAKAGASSSPLVDALRSLNIPGMVAIFNWIVIIASISSVDGGIYTASRMLYTQAREGHFSPSLARTNETRQVPTLAIAVTSSCVFIGAILAYVYPASAYIFVASLSSFGFLFAWLMISLSQPLYRRKIGPEGVANLKWKTPFYPLTPIVAIIAVLGALIGQFFIAGSQKVLGISIAGGGSTVVIGIAWTLLWSAYYLLYARKTYTHGDEWRVREEAMVNAWAGAPGEGTLTTSATPESKRP
jgi:L-asparagine transporter-like permease